MPWKTAMERRTSVVLGAFIWLHLSMVEKPEGAVHQISTNISSSLEFSGTILMEHKSLRIRSFNCQR